MFAVFRTGGKQYRVSPRDVIRIERLAAQPGEAIELGEVLAVGDDGALTVGQPLVEGARVAATVMGHTRGDKIVVFRKKRRKTYRRKLGHRQHLTVLRVDEILAAGQERSAPAVDEQKPAKRKTAAKSGARAKGAAKPKAPAKPKTSAKPKASAKVEAPVKSKKPAADEAKADAPAADKPAEETT